MQQTGLKPKRKRIKAEKLVYSTTFYKKNSENLENKNNSYDDIENDDEKEKKISKKKSVSFKRNWNYSSLSED